MRVYFGGMFYNTESVTIVSETSITVSMEDKSGIFYGGKLAKDTTITVQANQSIGWGVLPNAKADEKDKQPSLFSTSLEDIQKVDGQS